MHDVGLKYRKVQIQKTKRETVLYHITSFKGHGNCPIVIISCFMECIYTTLHTYKGIQIIIDLLQGKYVIIFLT